MDFTSIESLSAYLNSSAGQQTMTTSGFTIQQLLEQEARRLLNCIQKRINEYYESYTSSGIYQRTYGLLSMRVEDFIDTSIIDGKCSIKIDFDAADIQAHSLWGDDGDVYNTVELINSGWQVRNDVWFADIDRFGKFSGAHFIENGIADYTANNPYNLKIELQGFHS